ncbi:MULTISPECIES: hypothetical protein [unclassified Sulfuricurvum]|uniref:hypothetical protein n=1 Tax=unclassified Sulfuricurvum TaxID=2632390 RepID=UPI0002996131|nr:MULTISPECIES: hypothetical protein [unclassified Sulfuricurvum]AFV97576.1 hypothetical protein B649_06310 [Candidatus Sulfuricurvum sp. RIFRC-1]OHD89047.1 MAG: hypothetical protein A3G19_00780 [Sulfuricurvum sp. RIFCSPLOWO2_12_FULL_43_24]HBM36467.1 hypothetical protein [Sulfuricurvum sp.]
MKKILNEAKADSIAVYNALDIASGGNLSLIKQSIAQTFHGFLEAKFNNLVLDILSNEISEDELLEFIHSQSENNKEFISNLILKNMHADNRITTFLLAKLWIQKIKNGSLNYYESSLFANINSLTYEDFEIFYELWKNKKTTQYGHFYYEINEHQYFYIDAQNKLLSLGILEKPNVVGGFTPDKTMERRLKVFEGTGFSDFLFELLKDFFENN